MRQRTITAFFFALIMLGGIYAGAHTFFALFLFITAGSSWELSGLIFKSEANYVTLRRMVCTILTVILYVIMVGTLWNYFHLPFYPIIAGALLLLPLLAVFELFLAGERPFPNLGTYLLSLFYIGIPLILLAYIAQGKDMETYSPNRVLGLLLLVWTNDTGAYLFGSRFGKHKLFERISPKKTWEGTIGGAVFAVLIAWGLSFLIKDFTLPQWLALSVVAAIGSNLGDLIESMLKRSVGVKDSGTLLPGHGGLLDRFDAFIFCLPFYWLVLQVL